MSVKRGISEGADSNDKTLMDCKQVYALCTQFRMFNQCVQEVFPII